MKKVKCACNGIDFPIEYVLNKLMEVLNVKSCNNFYISVHRKVSLMHKMTDQK